MSEIVRIKKKTPIVIHVLSTTILVVLFSLLIWNAFGDYINYDKWTTMSFKHAFWYLYFIFNSLGLAYTIFAICCMKYQKILKYTMITNTLWLSSFLTIYEVINSVFTFLFSAEKFWILSAISYFIVATIMIVAIIISTINAKKNKEAINAILVGLQTDNPSSYDKYAKIYDKYNEISRIEDNKLVTDINVQTKDVKIIEKNMSPLSRTENGLDSKEK